MARTSLSLLLGVLLGLAACTMMASADYRPRIDWVNMLKSPKNYYRPWKVDWAAMRTGCKLLWEKEYRLRSFVIRAAFHDSMAVDVTACQDGKDFRKCGGADASNILNATELQRFENQGFTEFIAYGIRTLAMFYGASAADTLAFCGAVGIEDASDNRVKIIGAGGKKNFMVGRVDDYKANPRTLLGPIFTDTTNFTEFWVPRGITVEEGVALLGSHALLRPLGCSKSFKPGDDCDSLGGRPSVSWTDLPSLVAQPPMGCSELTSGPSRLRMFKWENHFFKDACSKLITTIDPLNETFAFPNLDANISTDALTNYVRQGLCGFASKKFRFQFLNATSFGVQFQPVLPINEGVTWLQDCSKGQDSPDCNHRTEWPYTALDGFLGKSCQGQFPDDKNAVEIGKAMDSFKKNQAYWDQVLVRAYLKMVTNFVAVKYPGRPSWLPPVYIDGTECPSGYVIDEGCAKSNKYYYPYRSKQRCYGCDKGWSWWCDKCCTCYSAYRPTKGAAVRAEADVGIYVVTDDD